MGQERFLVIAVTKGNPHSDGTVFESQDGVRLVVAAAGSDAKIFACSMIGVATAGTHEDHDHIHEAHN